MAFVTADRILETTSTSGTGTITLSGAKTGYRSFSSVMSTSDTCYYTIVDYATGNWEIGYGTLGSSTTLVRNTVISSSNANALVNFSSNVKDVFLDVPASQLLQVSTDGIVSNVISLTNPLTLPADPSLSLHASTKSYVDTQVATALPKSGGTLTGPLVLPADPNAPLQASTKQYVDTMVPLSGGIMTGPLLGSQTLTSGNASFDTRGATVVAGSNAIWLADGQTIAFDTAGSNTLSWNSTNAAIITPSTLSSPTFYGGQQKMVAWSGSTLPNSNFAFIGSVRLSGSTSNNLASGYSFSVTADTLDASATSGISHFLINSTMSSGFKGARNAFLVSANFTGTSGNGSAPTAQLYSAGAFDMNISASDGGTNISTDTKGSFNAINPQIVTTTSTAKNLVSVTAAEFDIGLVNGSTVASKSGISIVQLATDLVKGTTDDAAILITNKGGTSGFGWFSGIQFGSTTGVFPMSSTAAFISVMPQQSFGSTGRSGVFKLPNLKYGIDIRNAIFSSDAFSSPNFGVSGSGDIRFTNGTLAASSDGIKLDIPSQKVVAVAVATPGTATGDGKNNYFPGDRLTGPSGSSWYWVTATKVIAATIVAGGSGGTDGTQTVTGTTGAATKFQASVTVSGGTVTAILSITNAGNYIISPTNIAAEPVTGAGLTGAVLSLGMGILQITPLVPDISKSGQTGLVSYPNPVNLTNGSGSGATANLTWSTYNVLRLNSSGGVTIVDGSSLQVTNNAYVGGVLTLSVDPSSLYQAATKNYVDTNTVTKAYVDSITSPNIGRNKIDNSMFNISQRGSGPWTTAGYTFDRWRLAGVHSNGSMSVSQVIITDSAGGAGGRIAIGDDEPMSALSYTFVGGTAAGDYDLLQQAVENVRRLSGKTVTVSFWAAAGSGSPKMGIELTQNFGTGGSPSPIVSTLMGVVTLSTTWVRYSVTVALPNASSPSKVFGTDNNSATYLNFWLSSGSTSNSRAGNIGIQSNTVSFWGVQLEVGTVATPLEKLDYQIMLARCQRYYQSGVFKLYGYGTGGTYVGYLKPLPVSMRSSPAISPTVTTSTNCSINAFNYGVGDVEIGATITSTGSFGGYGTFTASAEY